LKIIPVILAGGAGTRLWPLSREDKPKQFHNISGEGTLLEETIKRLLPLNPDHCVIVTSKKYENASQAELDKTGISGTILAEPHPRNTAAAVIYAMTYLSKIADDGIMIMLPADHYIKNREMFVEVIRAAVEQAMRGKLVSIGIKPAFPETGYGYIKASGSGKDVMDVERFVEKPSLEKAREYVEDGSYFWNSGIFIWKLSVIEKCFRELMPGHYSAFEPLRSMEAKKIVSDNDDVWKIKKSVFTGLESISIDYGIMENAENRVVIPGEFGWADLGTWNAIDDILEPDSNVNRTPDVDDVIFINSSNCTAFPETKRITLVGLSNVVVVESGNDILVMEKNSAQEVRQVVEILKKQKKL
jgi:mannose-1-phosphate guanylyltransferase